MPGKSARKNCERSLWGGESCGEAGVFGQRAAVSPGPLPFGFWNVMPIRVKADTGPIPKSPVSSNKKSVFWCKIRLSGKKKKKQDNWLHSKADLQEWSTEMGGGEA